LALLLAASAGCRPPSGSAAVATGDPEAATGVPGIVTRIVERITFVTPTPDPAAPTPEEEQEPVVFDVSLSGELPNLDPALAEQDAQLDLAQNLFAGLTNHNPDTHAIEPELASEWAVSDDGRTWTFTLRDDIQWVRPGGAPGGDEAMWSAVAIRPVTADDVVFAVQRLCSRDVQHPLAFTLFIIEGCEETFTLPEPSETDRAGIGIRAVDPTRLEVRLTKPAGYFLTLTSMPFFQPVPRELVTEMGDEWLDAAGEYSTGWQTPDNLVTSGPYLPTPNEFTSQRVVLHRNSLWPDDLRGNVDIINITFFDDEMDAYAMWQERGLDIAPLPATEREAFMQRSAAKARVIPDQVLFYLGFDFDSQAFREPEVRRAFSAAIDRQALVDELYGGRGVVMRHATPPGVVAAIPVNEVGVGYSPDYARQQMAASSFRSCRLMPAITYLVSSADLSLRQAEIIREMWVEELDCLPENINIEQVQFGALLANTQPDHVGRPDLWELAWAPTFPDAHNVLNDLLHCQDSENRQNRDCSEADTLVRRAGASADLAERVALYRQAEALFFSEDGLFPMAPLYVRAREIAVQDWVAITPIPFGGQQWDRITLDNVTKELERSR
jgi:oligopeptide transport system substrate-binding protein